MLRIFISLLILFGIGMTEECSGSECEIKEKEEELSLSQITFVVNEQIRRIYWFYLRNSVLIYQVSVDTPPRSLHFFIYRNIVGTFLVVASWNKIAKKPQINTFVRIGNGFSKDAQTPYSPVNVQPFIISLRLAQGQYLVQADEKGTFRVAGKLINVEEGQQSISEEIDEKTQKIDDYFRQLYWYYLGGGNPALLVHKQSLLTTEKVYVVTTYINIVGTFLGIASCDDDDNVRVNTFVRLGAGMRRVEDIEELEPVSKIKEVQEGGQVQRVIEVQMKPEMIDY